MSCKPSMRDAVGEGFTDAELDEALARMSARFRREKARHASDADAMNAAREAVLADMVKDNLIEARMRRYAALAKDGRNRTFDAMYGRGFDEASALRAFNVGEESDAPGSGASVDAQGRALEADLTGTLLADLKASGVMDRLMKWSGGRDKPLEQQILREVHRLNGGDGAPAAVADVAQAAKAIQQTLKRAMDIQNEHGAWIEPLKGYMGRQSHDPIKISGGFWRGGLNPTVRERARKDWVAYIRPLLDEQSFDAIHAERARRAQEIEAGGVREKVDPEGFTTLSDEALEQAYLESIWYDITAGRHEGSSGALDDLDGFRPPPGKARAASKSRTLHFRDPEGWFAYNEKYGRGSMMEAVLGQVRRAARNAALMKAWGPNPRAAFDAHVQSARQRAKARGADTKVDNRLSNWLCIAEFEQLDGSADAPESVRIAAVSRAIRNWQQLSKLGGVVISAQTDTAFAANAMKRAGIDYLDAYSWIYKAAAGLDGDAARGVADDLRVASLAMAGDVAGRFNALDGAQGVMSRMLSAFYRANGFQFWNERLRRGAGVLLARNLGRKAKQSWAELDDATRGGLERYGVNERLWGLIRDKAQSVDEVGDLITVDAVKRIPADRLARALGMTPPGNRKAFTDLQLTRARREAETRLQAYFTDQADNALTEPRARERAMIRGGTQAGTVPGLAMELFMQFKSFPLTVITRQINPALRGVGHGEPVAAMAHLILSTAVLGFLTLQLKELTKGRMPRPAIDEDTGLPNGDLFVASLLQGGGAGIYGDLLMADYNRYGGGLAETLGGPAVGELSSLFRLYATLRDVEHSDQAPAQALRFAANNTPFANLFYVRPALDYLMLYHAQEALSPGYLDRYEQRIERENDQRFIVPPSEVVDG